MRIIERYMHGKNPDQSLNEDGLVVTDGFAAVVDGVTGKSVRKAWHPSGGVIAKDLAVDVISSLPPDTAMRQVQHAVDQRFRDAYRTHEYGFAFFEREPLERLQANAVMYSEARHEAWLFGDCQIMVNGTPTPTVKRVDELLGELRAFTTLALRERDGSAGRTGHTSDGHGDAARIPASAPAQDQAREMILPFLRLQSQFANKRGPYGYFVFDGFTDPDYPIRVVRVDPGDEVVLASDGYPLLRPTLERSEDELRRLRQEDPALIGEYRSTKGFTPGLDSFDDRTYLRFIA